jgi:hypothetical protein
VVVCAVANVAAARTPAEIAATAAVFNLKFIKIYNFIILIL